METKSVSFIRHVQAMLVINLPLLLYMSNGLASSFNRSFKVDTVRGEGGFLFFSYTSCHQYGTDLDWAGGFLCLKDALS